MRLGPLLALVLLFGQVALPDATAPAEASHSPFTRPLRIPQVLTGADITLTAKVAQVQILPGAKTSMWTYNGMFPGPTIRRPTGTTTKVTLVNALPAAAGELTLHNHGNHSSSADDGQPADFLAAPAGGSVAYTYTGLEAGGPERGAFQWYHDHRMNTTGRNLWMGLAGMYIIDDPSEPQTLPKGEFDVPLMITDRTFDAFNRLAYRLTPSGATGNHVLVNGVPQPYFNVGDRRYRIRILNASNARAYEFGLSNGQAFLQIGTESGLLPKPVRRTRVVLGPAERAELVIDFAGRLGKRLVLRDFAATGAASQVMEFRVVRDLTETSSVPASLRALPTLEPDSGVTRTFRFGRPKFGGAWTINGQVYNHHRIDAEPTVGSTETWVLENDDGAAHFVHIHGADQILVSRNGKPPAAYERIKETWSLKAGERLVLRVRFSDHVGPFVFHCHVLEHEDLGMMANFEVLPGPAS
jgi:FtsP/CotA-like multicopper oxidase with cupredoxin domain